MILNRSWRSRGLTRGPKGRDANRTQEAACSSEERSRLGSPRVTEGVRGRIVLVRLPQPMGAGGQQPLRPGESAGVMLRQTRLTEAITVKYRVIRRRIPAARTAGPTTGNRQQTKMPCRRQGRRMGLTPAEKPGKAAPTWALR